MESRRGGLCVRDCRTVPDLFSPLARGVGIHRVGARKCLVLYYYFMDRDFRLIHVRLQTWFPLQVQVYVNGHEWLARTLAQHGGRYTKRDNAFLWLEDFARAQRWSDRFVTLPWIAPLDRYARRVNPLLRDVLTSMGYDWVTAQAEYATELLFKHRAQLADLAPARWNTQHALLFCPRRPELPGAEVAREVRRRRSGDGIRLCRMPSAARTAGQAPHETELVEDVRESRLDSPGGDGDQRSRGFRVRRLVRRRGRRRSESVPLRKSVAYLFRYRDVALQSNARYLNTLAQVDDPTPGLRGLGTITIGKQPPGGRTMKPFNPVARLESELFRALMSGEHAVHGFANRDLRAKLTGHLRPDPKQQSAQISRLLHRLHVYGRVAKIPRSRRWRVTAFGHRVTSASVRLRQLHVAVFYAEAA
jgi:hypothetical protein